MLIINPKSKPGYRNYHFTAGSLKDGICPASVTAMFILEGDGNACGSVI